MTVVVVLAVMKEEGGRPSCDGGGIGGGLVSVCLLAAFL